MKKMTVAAALVLAASAMPALGADLMYKKAAPIMAPAPVSAFDIAFGTALTTDYVLRGISQSNRQPAVQGYVEPSYAFNDWFKIYVNLWGSSLYTGLANAEFDLSGGVRFSWNNFGLDVGYVYYFYPGAVPGVFDFGEFYAKPSYKFTDWLTVGGSIVWGNDFNSTGLNATYFTANAAVTLPPYLPMGITSTISAEIGRQTFDGGIGATDYTTWNIGVAFAYKAMTLDLRYYDTDLSPATSPGQCISATGRTICNEAFVATLKFDTTLAALK